MNLTIPILEKISLNKIYSGVHWSVRNRHVEDADSAVAYLPHAKPYKGKYPVHVHYHFLLAGTALDISNHGYMVKLVEDSLVKKGVLKGDQPKYVAGITVTAEKVSQHCLDVVEVTVTPC